MEFVTDLSVLVCIDELKNYINYVLNKWNDKEDNARYAIFNRNSLKNGDPIDIINMNDGSPIKESSTLLNDLMKELIFGKDRGDYRDNFEKDNIWCSVDVYKDDDYPYDLVITIHDIPIDLHNSCVQSFINNLKNSNKK